MDKWQKYYLKFVGGTVVNAAAFVAYRLYMHHQKHKLTYVEFADFKPIQTEPSMLVDFSECKAVNLSALNFIYVDDELGERQCAFFKYKNIFILMSRLSDYLPHQYLFSVDIPACYEETILPSELLNKFLQSAGFSSAPVTWKNEAIDEHLKLWETRNIAQARIEGERRDAQLNIADHIRTKALAQLLHRIPLMDYTMRGSKKFVTLDFSRHEELIEGLTFEEKKDSSIACYTFDELPASIRRKHDGESYHYDIYIKERGDEFIRALGFRNVPKVESTEEV